MRRLATRRSTGSPLRSSTPSWPGRTPISRFLAALCRAPNSAPDDFDTGFIERNLDALGAVPQGIDQAAAAFGARELLARDARGSPTASIATPMRRHVALGRRPTAFSFPAPRTPDAADPGRRRAGRGAGRIMTPDGPAVTVDGVAGRPDAIAIEAADAVYVLRHGRQTVVAPRRSGRRRSRSRAAATVQIKAPMHGKVLALLVEQRRARGEGPASRHHRGHEDGARPDRAARRPRRRTSRSRPEARSPRAPADDDRGEAE